MLRWHSKGLIVVVAAALDTQVSKIDYSEDKWDLFFFANDVQQKIQMINVEGIIYKKL